MPRKNEYREYQIRVYLTEEEYDMIVAYAKMMDQPLSIALRRTALLEMDRHFEKKRRYQR